MWYMIWCEVMWCDIWYMMYYMVWSMIWYMVWCDVMWYNIRYCNKSVFRLCTLHINTLPLPLDYCHDQSFSWQQRTLSAHHQGLAFCRVPSILTVFTACATRLDYSATETPGAEGIWDNDSHSAGQDPIVFMVPEVSLKCPQQPVAELCPLPV
jgi:hypothetical protein